MDRVSELAANVPEEVKELFERLTLQLISLGIDHYSSDAILHRIRWHKHVESGDRSFKCNDHWTAYLSRWFVWKYPQHADFFSFRKLGCNHENYEFFYMKPEAKPDDRTVD